MGNTPAKDRQQDMYSEYIRQQQELIYKQQQQINSLYQFNLENADQSIFQTNPSMNSNPSIPNDSNSNFNRSIDQTGYDNNSLKITSQKKKLDPYDILGIPKKYDEKTLKKAYLKAAMRTHPDRGGSRDEFQKVSIAYAVLTKKLKELKNNHLHHDLKNMSKEYSKNQANKPEINVNMTENFDVNVFNKIYDDNRINDVYDDGYESWMEHNKADEIKMIKGDTKMFQNNFNKDLFNSTFEKYKKEQQQSSGTKMVEYNNPETRISMKNQDSLMVLGQEKIKDFGGSTDNLDYTDYKRAFTDGSILIDVNSVDISNRSSNMNSIKSQRSNLSYKMNSRDTEIFSRQQIDAEISEQNRLRRLKEYDQRHSNAYEKIHSMLLN